jgi:riboflavin synthase
MFTGIITDIGTVRSAEQRGDLRLTIACRYDLSTVARGASLGGSGVCLHVVGHGAARGGRDGRAHSLSRTAAGLWTDGARLNLERALRLGDELGGHLVTGHVDGVGAVVGICADGASTRIGIAAPADLGPYIAAKGSITLDGVSLTVNEVRDADDGTTHFAVNIIPHTADHSTLGAVEPGRQHNIEIDILARYLKRMADARR